MAARIKKPGWRPWGDHPWFVAVSAAAAVATVVGLFLQFTRDPSLPALPSIGSATPGPSYLLRFFLLTDRQVRRLPTGQTAFEAEFRLVNSTSPSEQVHNVFGELWLDGKYLISSTLPPARGRAGEARVEWDIRIAVFPREGVFLPPKIALRAPPPGQEIVVGAQFVSKETQRQEYLWRIINENGQPRIVVLRNPDDRR